MQWQKVGRLSGAVWSCVLVGIAVTVVNGYTVSLERETDESDSQTGGMQHHHS